MDTFFVEFDLEMCNFLHDNIETTVKVRCKLFKKWCFISMDEYNNNGTY